MPSRFERALGSPFNEDAKRSVVKHKLSGQYTNNLSSPRFNVIQQQRETSMGRCSIASLNHNDIEDDLPPDPMLQTNTISNTPRDDDNDDDEEGTVAKGQREKQHSPRLVVKPMTLQEKTMSRATKQQRYPDTRNEIIAVAPKKN